MSEAEVQVPADVFAEAAGDAELAAFVKEVQTAAVDSNKPYALRVMSNGKFLQWTVGPYRGVANAAFKRGAGNFRGHGTNGESAAKTGRFTLVLAPRTVHLVLTDDKGELVFDFTAGGWRRDWMAVTREGGLTSGELRCLSPVQKCEELSGIPMPE